MKFSVIFALGLLAAPMAYAADAPAPVYVFTAEQAAAIAAMAAEKRAAAMQVYNQANDLIADIQKQTEANKAKDEGKK